MRKVISSIILCVLLNPFFILSQSIRKPVFSGKFYPSNPNDLSKMVEEFLNKTQIQEIKGEIKGIIAPHAAYVYSGEVAAYSYKLIQGKNYETVIIIAPTHNYGFYGCSIYPYGYYKTPLGYVKIDEVLAKEIMKNSGFDYIPKIHIPEHSIEVQIPFIQKVLPAAKIVPIIMGYQRKNTIKKLAKALTNSIRGKKVLIIASTDMSHYHSKKKANQIDQNTISLLKAYKCGTLIRKIERGAGIMCGGGPVVSMLLAIKSLGRPEVKILKYGDSADAGGPPSKVVGYLAAAIIIPEKEEIFFLTSKEKKELLKIARQTIESFILKKEIPNFNINSKNLLKKRGVFVTIKENDKLRGCIGFTAPVFPLYQTVMRAAIFASTCDPRFPPLSPQEFPKIKIEISVLTPLKKITNPNKIIIGKHGILISKKGRRGLLLPQVAIENNWDRIEFLNQTCYKAGLPRNCWKKNAEIYIFEAIIFGEH
jgi:hypothetical protein